MVILGLLSIPIMSVNSLNQIAALALLRGADFLSVFDPPQRQALAMQFLNLHAEGFGVAGIFWGSLHVSATWRIALRRCFCPVTKMLWRGLRTSR
jgi:hypothetical protein